MMKELRAGQIIYFTPFYFKNGRSAPKPKYFIVLKKANNESILASLPTRKDSIPNFIASEETTGCFERTDIFFNVFRFDKQTIITTNGKQFDFPTFVYGVHIDSYNISDLKEVYPVENTDYEIWGRNEARII